jgi:hypothetical protein
MVMRAVEVSKLIVRATHENISRQFDIVNQIPSHVGCRWPPRLCVSKFASDEMRRRRSSHSIGRQRHVIEHSNDDVHESHSNMSSPFTITIPLTRCSSSRVLQSARERTNVMFCSIRNASFIRPACGSSRMSNKQRPIASTAAVHVCQHES